MTVEFDADVGYGSAGLGIIYSDSLTTYAKWPLGWERTTGNSGSIVYYDDINAIPPTTLQNHTFKLTKENSDELMYFKANTWQHYKLLLDLDNMCFTLYIDGEKSSVTGEIPFLSGSNSIGGIVFFTGRGSTGDLFLIDNIKVYRTECDVVDAVVCDSEGNRIKGNINSSISAGIKVDFTNAVKTGTVNFTLTEKSLPDSEEVTVEWKNGDRTAFVKPGYFKSNKEYKLTVDAGFKDVYGQECSKSYVYSFKTNEGGLNIVSLKILKNGNETAIEDISPGDVITVSTQYVLTEITAKKEGVILGFSAEKSNKLVGFSHKTVNFDQLGNNKAEFDITLNNKVDFDKITAFMWENKSRMPLIEEFCMSK